MARTSRGSSWSSSMNGSGRSKSSGPRASARHPHLPGERIHRAQVGQERLVLLPLAPRVAAQRRGDPRVVQARARMNHRREEVARDRLRLPVEIDADHHRQPILFRDQRADVRRQRLGQHRDGAVGEVDAAAAPERLGVQRRPLAHVVRDVGDRDPQPRTAVRQRFDRDGVVEVARRLGIDGRERHVAQVGAVGAVGLAHLLRDPVGDARDVVGKGLLDVGARQDLLDLGARVVGVAQHLEDGGLDRTVGDVGIAGDLGDDGDAVGRVGDRARAA